MKKQVLSIVLILSSTFLGSQFLGSQTNDPIVMKVNGKDVKKSEFEYIYRKNNNEDAVEKMTLEEYIARFKDFKLKVAEAEIQKLDTTENFRTELKEYRDQLAKPYLTSFPLNEELIRKEYNRMKENVEISHIMVTFSGKNTDDPQAIPNKVYPADTLSAYKKTMLIRKRLLKGEDFGQVAIDVSNDRRSIQSDRPGYLGWFSGLMLIPAMEEAAYSTLVGEVSMPVRTSFGYHLIKVHKRQMDPGEIRAAHILISCPATADTIQVSDAEKKIDGIYQQVLRGEDFGELAKKYSDDKGSATDGGDLSFFGFGQMVKGFQEAAFGLKEIGEVTPPVRSQFGFHLIKLLDKRPIASFEEQRDEIINRLQRNGSYMALIEPGMEKLKRENGFSLNENVYKTLQQAANTFFPADSSFTSQFENNENALFITNNTPYTIAQFMKFIQTNNNPFQVLSTDLLNDYLKGFESYCLIQEEDKLLESKYPEFGHLIQEYRDGILLFAICSQEVWDKASNDIDGLRAYFSEHKADYAWDKPHYKGYIVLCKDNKTKKKMQKEIAKMAPDSAVIYLFNNYNVGDVSYVKIEKGLYVQGDNPYVDEAVFKAKKSLRPKEYQDFFVMGKLLPNVPEDYTDVRGLVITDYQTHLEKLWIENLNKKYPVVIYPDVVNSIK